MKKLGAFLVGVSLVAGSVFAANTATSVNAVGFVQQSVTGGNLLLMSDPFTVIGGTTNKLLIGEAIATNGLPDGTVVYIFNGSTYQGETFYEGYGWDPGTNKLGRSDGFWLQVPTNANVTVQGEVPGASYAPSTTTVLSEGYQLVSYPYPAQIAASNTTIGAVAGDEDIVYQWNGSTYDGYTFYVGYGWDPQNLVFKPGQGFWYYKKAAGSVSWVEPIPYSLQ